MKISKTQLRQIIKEELGTLAEEEEFVPTMKSGRPYTQSLLSAAIEAISEHQTRMDEPSNLLAYALEQLNELMGKLGAADDASELGPDTSDFINSRQTPGQWEDANPGLSADSYRATRAWYKNKWGG
jgi:hypothetical protein